VLYRAWQSMQGMSVGGKPAGGDEAPKWATLVAIDELGRFAELNIAGQALRLRYCPPAAAVIGSPPDEAGRQAWENRHQVSIPRGFWMLSTEVTQGLYEAVMKANPSSTRGATLPVESVTFEEATAFCTRLAQHGLPDARLPSEAEWEYACRGGETGPFAGRPAPPQQGWMAPPELVKLWRATPEDEAEAVAVRWVAQHLNDGELGLKPVGTLAANRFGLFDLHGNVLEWCGDHWDGRSPYPEGEAAATTGDLVSARGGCWFYPPERCRSASRLALAPGATLNYVGFRFVVPAAPKK
jgi:formylglycine-generating enzyme required for sulfatase activity